MKICPSCGYKQSADNKFCIKCGHSMQDVPLAGSKKADVSNKVKISSSNVNAGLASASTTKRLSKADKRKRILIGIAILIVAILFGGYKYYTSAAHNPNNPLSNQTITFQFRQIYNSDPDDDDDDSGTHKALIISNKTYINIAINMLLIMYKKKDKKVYDYLNSHKDIVNYLSNGLLADMKGIDVPKPSNKIKSEVKALDKLAKNDNQIMEDWHKWLDSAARPAEDIALVSINPNYGTEAKNGQKVRITLAGKTSILKKYGIDTKPRVVRISGLKN